MERAPRQFQPVPQSTEVSREEKRHITPPADKQTIVKSAHKTISLKQLINKLNHINFHDNIIQIVFFHTKHSRRITLEAQPLPCQDEQLTCNWTTKIDSNLLSESYRFECLYIPQNQQLFEVKPELKSISKEQIVFLLPETCRDISQRKISRFECLHTSVYMIQNSVVFRGALLNFCPSQLLIRVNSAPPQTFKWLNSNTPVTIVLTKRNESLYSGQCHIIRYGQGRETRDYLLKPIHNQASRFKPKEFRSTRQRLSPTPDVVFDHPFFEKLVNLKVLDLSGSGIAVKERQDQAVLLPGMIIPELAISFSDGSNLKCKAQVIYSKPQDEEDDQEAGLRCGLAILDIPMKSHVKLLAILQKAKNANAYLCNKIDLNALWNLFFETGFIYPQKYAFIQANKDKIKATYEKLYNQNSNIATHFIYQENGRILAHMGMVRFYENSWLIHHHAAIRSSLNRGGLVVLNQAGRFINDSHRLHSMKMDYVFCFFRPDNKFPNHVFGGTARHIRNPSICSLDNFAYFYFHDTNSSNCDLPKSWQIDKAHAEDLLDLNTIYQHESGGLLMHGLQLEHKQLNCDELFNQYRSIGLKRDRHIFALRHCGKLIAIIEANLADLGLNMSNLTNSIKVLLINQRNITSDIVHKAIKVIMRYYEHAGVPVLLYPKTAADQLGIKYQKIYSLWVLNLEGTDYYFRFLKRLLKFIQH